MIEGFGILFIALVVGALLAVAPMVITLLVVDWWLTRKAQREIRLLLQPAPCVSRVSQLFAIPQTRSEKAL